MIESIIVNYKVECRYFLNFTDLTIDGFLVNMIRGKIVESKGFFMSINMTYTNS